jgi:hypothetical protein
MIRASVVAIAGAGLFAVSGPVVACEMHGNHLTLQTAAVQPQAVPPPVAAPAPKPEPVVLQTTPAPAAVKAMSVPETYGAMGCPHMRKKQTVYYTD